MKHLLLTTIAALVLVGCGPSGDIWTAAKEGNTEAVKKHIAAGADVNAKNKRGMTPLHHAAIKGREEIVELLIASGAEDGRGYAFLDFDLKDISAAMQESEDSK
jgi:ankyrin repeat protein